jgi:hypothetical protein
MLKLRPFTFSLFDRNIPLSILSVTCLQSVTMPNNALDLSRTQLTAG